LEKFTNAKIGALVSFSLSAAKSCSCFSTYLKTFFLTISLRGATMVLNHENFLPHLHFWVVANPILLLPSLHPYGFPWSLK